MTGSAAGAGYADAADRIAVACALGATVDQIAAAEDARASWLLSEATTDEGRAYAAEYDNTARTLIADLHADEAEAARIRPPAGTPHPDRAMAALGWHVSEHGIYVKGADAGPADVAALE